MTKYYKSGLQLFPGELELKDFTWWVDWSRPVNMTFELATMTLYVQVYLNQGGVEYNKMMPISIPQSVAQSDIDNGLLLLPQFENSTIVP